MTQIAQDFKICQICHTRNDDICHFRMWQECDAQDKPIPNKMLIVCQEKKCLQVIEDDSRLFIEVPWSQGGPGKFMLLCGNCSFRDGYACKHPNLKENGGQGLLIHFSQTFLSNVRVCMTDGTSLRPFGNPATQCEGNPNDHRK